MKGISRAIGMLSAVALLAAVPFAQPAVAQDPTGPQGPSGPVTAQVLQATPAVAPTPVQTIYAGGISYNAGASPAVAGSGLFAHAINSSGTYAFTAIDALPNTYKPFTVSTNVGIGVAQKVATIAGIDIFAPTAAGISFSGSNTGWQWSGGALAAIHVKNNYYLMPSVRFLKSSVSGGTGYQPIVGILFGWGK